MTHYMVSSPEISEVVPVLDDGTGPTEYFCCVAFVVAETKANAKLLALKTPDFREWVDQQRGDGRNPLWGLKAEDAACPHGKCWCDDCLSKFGECDECMSDAH